MSCWWENVAEVAQLIWWLEDQGLIESASDAACVADHPQRWTKERTDMQVAFRSAVAA